MEVRKTAPLRLLRRTRRSVIIARAVPGFYTYSIVLNESNAALNAESFSQIGHSAKLPANQLTGGFNFGGPIFIRI